MSITIIFVFPFIYSCNVLHDASLVPNLKGFHVQFPSKYLIQRYSFDLVSQV
jgi:hypothetical protein